MPTSTQARLILIAFAMLAALLAEGRPALADAEYNPILSTKIVKMHGDDAFIIKRAPSLFRFVGDEARVFLRTDYDLQTIYIPIALVRVVRVDQDYYLLKIVEKTDQVTTANWVAFDELLDAERSNRYETAMTEARTLINKGQAQKANALLDKLIEAGFSSIELEALTTGIDLKKVRTPDGRRLEEVVTDPALRKRLAEADNYMLTLRMLRKKDWPDALLLPAALKLLPTLGKPQREELEITLF